jgi:hypothetical protein
VGPCLLEDEVSSDSPRWHEAKLHSWAQRWRLGSTGLRILREDSSDPWRVRWSSRDGAEDHEEFLPADTPVEVAQALAVALWRMK